MNVLNNRKRNIQYKKSQSTPETNHTRINENNKNIIQKENHSNFNYNKINLTTIKNEEHLNINMNSPTKNNAEMKKSNTLKIIQLNIRSMRKHFNELIIKINELKPDIIALCEIFLSESELNLYKIPNYTCYAQCRPDNEIGGGVMIFVKNEFSSCELNIDDSNESFESVGIEIQEKNWNF